MKTSSTWRSASRDALFLFVVIAFAARMHGAFYGSSFAPHTDISANGGQIAIAVGDLDGDGKPDVVVGGASIAVYRNVATPGVVNASSFAPRVEFASGNIIQIRLADLDGDGRKDIVALNETDRSVYILRNISTPGVINSNSFVVQVLPPVPVIPTSIAIGDFDGDGRPDLVVSCYFPGGPLNLFQNASTPGAVVFGPRVLLYSVAAYNVESGDIDGDGKPDLVVGRAGNEFWVFRNVYGGGLLTKNAFAEPFYFPGGNGASVTLGDIDGDGKLDVVTANALDNTISLWRNTATPGIISRDTFPARIDFPTAAYPYRVVLGDLDGDGRPEIVTAHSSSASMAVFQNLSAPGAMILAPRVDYPTGPNPRISVIADIDGDGRPDLACANGAASFSVLRQLPPPPPPPRPQITTNPVPIAVLFGNSAMFTVSATGTNLSYRWLFQGTPVFAAVSPSLTVTNAKTADAGDYAAVVSNEGGSVTSVLARLTVVAPPPPQVTTQPVSQTVAVGYTATLNVGASGTNLTYQWYFQGSPKSNATTSTLSITNAMLGHAGAYAVVVGNGGGSVTSEVVTLTVQLDPTYEPHVEIPASTINAGIAFGDLDGDGKPEAIVADYQYNLGSVSVYRNLSMPGSLGTNSFAPPVSFPVGAEPVQTFLADLDGDGKPDIVCVCQNGLEVSVLRNTTAPGVIDSNSFAPRIALSAAERPVWAAVADLNGDGKLDLIVVTYYGNRFLSVFENTSTPGTLSFASPVALAFGADSFSVEAGDIDGDGKADIVACRLYTPIVWVFRNTHTGGQLSFDSPVSFPTGNAASVKLADMDGDGKLDIVLANASEDSISVLRNTSTPGVIDTNSFAARVDFPAGDYPYRPAIADLNGDGRPDVITANAQGDTISVFLNTASPGSFTTESLAPRTDYPTGNGPRVAAVADIDGDGWPDLACANLSQTAFSVLRHAGPPPPPPEIIAQPASQSVPLGSNAVFSVTSHGFELQYQWLFNGIAKPGATAASLNLAGVTPAQSGNYAVVVSDRSGSVTSSVATLNVQTFRTLAVASPPARDEGDIVSVPIVLESDGSAGGMTFILAYNPDYLSVPELAWDAVLEGASRQWHLAAPGQTYGAFAGGTPVPAGTQVVAVVNFRARSMITNSHTALALSILDVSTPAGDPIHYGTATRSGSATIIAGATIGDANGNHRLDVGDATLLLRLLAQLDTVRPWDIVRNDVESSDTLDYGDVLKILLAAAGVEPQPGFAAGQGKSLPRSGGTPLEQALLSPAIMRSTDGQSVKVQVVLDGIGSSISGASFTLNYPPSALRLAGASSHHIGNIVPLSASAVWNVSPAQTNYAAQNGRVTLAVSSASAWSTNNGVLAEFVFEVQPGATNQIFWPLTLSAVEVSSLGYNRFIATRETAFIGREPRLMLAAPTRLPGGQFQFNLDGETQAAFVIDASVDLANWITLTNILNAAGPLQFSDPGATGFPQRFYRVRLEVP